MNPADIATAKLYFGKRYPESRFDYSGMNCIYIGVAAKGTATSEAGWLIFFLTYNSDNMVTLIQSSENAIWDNRITTVFA